MSAFIHPPAARTSYSSIIHREPGSITGLRKIFDRITRLSVWTFPFSMIDEFAPRLMAVPAAYILADHRSIYVGESHNVGRRLLEHSTDNSKLFAREVFVISAFDTEWFDKASAIQLQHRLTHLAKASGLVELRLGDRTSPFRPGFSAPTTACSMPRRACCSTRAAAPFIPTATVSWLSLPRGPRRGPRAKVQDGAR
jgi:predicted GIY-YIG superfamily endonuclease